MRFELIVEIMEDLVSAEMIVPNGMEKTDAPNMDRDLTELERMIMVSVATAFKNAEVFAGKHKRYFEGYINKKLIIDRPIPGNIKQ